MRIADIIGVAAMFLIIAFVGWRSSKKVKNINDFTQVNSYLTNETKYRIFYVTSLTFLIILLVSIVYS